MFSSNALFYNDCVGIDNSPQFMRRMNNALHVSAGDINPATGKAYAINPSSGVWDDNYFANTYGGASQYADSTITSSVNTYGLSLDEYNKRYKEFDAANPFSFDDMLAKETAKVSERLDPYYEQTLNDYLTGVNLKKSRTLEDQRTLLTNLQADTESYQAKDKQALIDTLDRTRQGYADAGTYFSGARQRAEGSTVAGDQKNMADYLRGVDTQKNTINTTATRGLQDINLDQSQTQRDIGTFDANGNYVPGATPAYEIKSQALSAANQDQSLWQYQKNQYLGAPPGADYSLYANENSNLLGKTSAIGA
jgi:hypothetical protein